MKLSRIQEFNELCERFRDPKSRVDAERVLLEFRKSRDAIEQSINIIVSKDTTGFAKFQATSLCRDVVLERWTRLDVQQHHTIREHLLKYTVTHFNDLPKFVSKQLLHVVASFYKRAWTGLSEEEVNAVFTQIQTIMRQNVRCANLYLHIIVDEFLSSRSSAIGLKLEWHRNVQQHFSTSGLRRCLEMGMLQIAEIVRRSGGNDKNMILELDNADGHVLSSFLKLLTQILSFNFNDSSSNEFVCPGPRWRDLILHRGLITVLFRMYYRIRNDSKPRSNLMHACREAIISMASVHGDIFASEDARAIYVGTILSETLRVFGTPPRHAELRDEEIVDLSRLLRRAVLSIGLPTILRMKNSRVLVQNLKNLTIHLMHEASNQSVVSNTWYCEAFDFLLEVWSHLALDEISKTNIEIRRFLAAHCASVFESYITYSAIIAGKESEEEEEEEDESSQNGDADLMMFEEQMDTAVSIGRFSVSQGVAKLDAMIKDMMCRLSSKSTLNVMGALRWSVRASSFLLADRDEGEEPMIPSVFMIPDTARSCALLIRTVMNVVSSDLNTTLRNGKIMSTGLVSDMLNAMCRIFATYLAPNVSELYDSTDMAFPEIILRICGRKTAESISMLRLGVKYAYVALALSTSSRNHLAAARLLRLVSKLHGTRDLLFQLDEWTLILGAFVGRSGGNSSGERLRIRFNSNTLFKGKTVRMISEAMFRSSLSASQNDTIVRQSFGTVLRGVLSRPCIISSTTSDSVSTDIKILVSQSLRGMIVCTTSRNTTTMIEACVSIFPKIKHTLQRFHHGTLTASSSLGSQQQTVLCAILKFLRDLSEALVPYVHHKTDFMKSFYETCMICLNCFRTYHLPRVRVAASGKIDDADCKTVSAIVSLTNTIVSECIDDEDLSAVLSLVNSCLQIVLPLVAKSDMQIPKLQKNMFSLLRVMCESLRGAAAFVSLDSNSFNAFGRCLIFGTEHDNTEAIVDAYRAIRGLAVFRIKSQSSSSSSFLDTFLAQLLQRILDLAARNRLPQGTAFDSASNALLLLVAIGQVPYRNLVLRFLNHQRSKDPSSVPRLSQSFTRLTQGVDLRLDAVWSNRRNRTVFLENLKKFMFDVQGFMEVK